jgi:hypothetical protein
MGSTEDCSNNILVVHEGLWMSSTVKTSLINPNQIRAHGTEMQDNPFGGTMFIKGADELDPNDIK